MPALVGAVSNYTDCSIEISDVDDDKEEKNRPKRDSDSNTGVVEIVDNRPAVPNYKTKKAEEGKKAVDLVLNHFKIFGKGKKAKLTFGGNLCCASRIGARQVLYSFLGKKLSKYYIQFRTLHFLPTTTKVPSCLI